MRDLITAIAIVVLLALTAALVGPHVVDWDSRRAEISRQLSAALGQDVRIEGPISLTLIPTPSLKLGHVSLGEGGPLSGTIGRIRASAAIPPLLRGEIRLTDARLQGGRLTFSPDRRLNGPASMPLAMSVSRLTVGETHLAILAGDGARLVEITDIQGTLDAQALHGPYRGTLGFTALEARRTLRFSTGRITDQGLRLRATTENDLAAARTEYDGAVSWADGQLTLDGRLSASGNAELDLPGGLRNMLWRADAQVKGNAAAATADQIELAFGPSDKQAVLSGTADVSLAGTPRISATLASRQIDIDRLLARDDGQPPATPEALLRHLLASARNLPGSARLPLGIKADVTVGSILLGRAVVAAPRVVLDADPGGWRLERAEGEFPGRARISLRRGDAGAGPVSVDVRDLPALFGWLQSAPPQPQPVRSFSFDGALALEPQGFTVTDATLRADEMRFTGRFGVDAGGERPRVSAALQADQLDILKMPDFGDGSGEALTDLDLTLDARRVRYAGVGAGSIRAALTRTGKELQVRELTVTDLGGASMRMTGGLGGAAPRLDATVQGERLEALLELLDRLLPHPVLPHLKARARVLAPARLTFAATPAAAGRWAASLAGSVGGTDVSGVLGLTADGGVATEGGVDLDISAASFGPLMRKAGLPAIDAPDAGPVRMKLTGGGLERNARAPWSLKGTIGNTSVDITGDLKPDVSEAFAGRIAIEARDISPLAQTLLVTVPRVAPGQPLRLGAGIDLRGYKITLRDVEARVGAIPVTGEIAFDLAQFGRVAGQLRTPYFDAGAIAPLVFGEGAGRPDGWSAAAFPRPAGVTLPGDLWIEAAEARLMDGLAIANAAFVLRFDDGLLFLEHARGRMAGVDLQASGTLRRTGRSVALAGRLGFAGALGPARTIDGEVELTALGDSPAQLVSAISGNGGLRFRQLGLPMLARGSFSELAQLRDRSDSLSRALVSERLRGKVGGGLNVPEGESRLTVAGGVVSAGPLDLNDGENAIRATLSYDLRSFSLGARMAYTASASPKGWSGPPPQATLIWRGPIGRTRLEVEADDFANGLTALAIQRETDRIDALEQDQRERAFFNRRLRASEEERRAAEEDRRKAEEERRRAEIAARQRAERERAERLRAEEEQRSQPASTPPMSILPPPAR